MGHMANWAESNRLSYTTFKDLSSKPEIYQLVATEIARVNQNLPKVAQIRRFALFDKELHADDGELTHTQNVRRATVGVKYRDMIEALYIPNGG
jgi:long-chain acyl-CoA synthetase